MPSVTKVRSYLPQGFKPRFLDLSRQQTAIIQSEPDGKPSINHNVALPSPEPHQFLVKNIAVAINQCDWKMPLRFPSPGATIGCDLYGTVIAIGPKAAAIRPDINLGDRVCGAIHGSNPIDHPSGSFAEYVAAHADIVIKVPDSFSHVEAAAIGGTSLSTLRLALWDSLKLVGTPDVPLDPSLPIPHVLVYGGSTSTGTMTLQLLRL
jgi:NADPH:quinone reductase-like Zn-dependent oxidoreductase